MRSASPTATSLTLSAMVRRVENTQDRITGRATVFGLVGMLQNKACDQPYENSVFSWRVYVMRRHEGLEY